MTAVRHSAFHALRVRSVERLTQDAVAVVLDVPPELRAACRFAPGQHIVVRRVVGDTEIRRTYSLCDPAPASEAEGPERLRIGVRLVDGGEFSTYALKELTAGDTLEVMSPAGRFGHVLEPTAPGHYAAVVGGSGITPVLSMAATVLARQPSARFSLIRSDRTVSSTMFLEEVADLKDRYPDRLQLVHVLSREEQQAGLPSGRLDEQRLAQLLPALMPPHTVDVWFLCGPHGLVRAAEQALDGLGVHASRIHQEIFHVDDGSIPVPAESAPHAAATGTIGATLGGRTGTWPSHDGETLLETVLRNRPDAPYACKGGVCGTCRAHLVAGEVRMSRNFALEPDEVAAGYVLACQSRPLTEQVEVDFDA